MARPSRALARRAKRLLGYWRSETRTLRQGLVALVLSTAASFVAGLTLGSITDTLSALPGLLVLIPASVGMRGTIFGAVGARLGTGIHAGLFEATLRKEGLLRQNVEVAILSTFLSSAYLAVMAKLVAAAFGENTISVWDLLTISVTGGVLASAAILVVTVRLAVLSFRRGWDLDAVSTPMVTAIGDMVTLPALFLATFVVRLDVVNAVLAGLSIAAAVAALAVAALRSPKATKRVLVEMIPIITLVPLLDILAGALLEERRPAIQAVPGVLMMIPPFVSQAGALGGILSSRLTSKLRLGVIGPRGWPQPPAIVDGSLVVIFGVTVFATIGAAAWALSELTGLGHPGAMTMIAATLLAGLMTLPITLAVGYYVAVLSSRAGLDPDNHGVPMITSLMDLVGVGCILLAMSVSGVTIHG
jgi:mgtE-like transporter